MISAIIVDNRLNSLKNLFNNVINHFKEIQLTHIATTILEAYNIIANNQINLVFISLDIIDSNTTYTLNKLYNINILNINTTFIFYKNNTIKKNISNLYTKSCVINMDLPLSTIHANIKQIINCINNQFDISKVYNNIIDQLLSIGYNFKYKGTQYILDSIFYIYKKNNISLLDNLEKNVFPHICTKYSKSLNNIKTNIIKATNYAYLYQNKNLIKSYFKMDIKPTPKIVISIILDKVTSHT